MCISGSVFKFLLGWLFVFYHLISKLAADYRKNRIPDDMQLEREPCVLHVLYLELYQKPYCPAVKSGNTKQQLLRNQPYAIIDEKLKGRDTIERKVIYHTGK